MEIVFSSTTQLAAAIRQGQVSAVEALEAHLAQIDQHNPALNAIVTMDPARARERARAADDALARGEVSFPGLPVAATIREAIERLAQELRHHGAIVEVAPLPQLDFNQEIARAGDLIGMMLGAFQPQEGRPPTALRQYMEALHRRDQSIVAWERFFQDWDGLLCPPSMTPAFPHCEPGSPLRIDGQDAVYWLVPAHSTLFNYTGHPAVVLPYTRDRDGLPIGVQIVGERWHESRLLALAEALAPETGDFHRPPGY